MHGLAVSADPMLVPRPEVSSKNLSRTAPE